MKFNQSKINRYDRRYVKMTKEDAEKCGQVVYWDENKCVRGHNGWRYKAGHCVGCSIASQSKASYKKYDSTQADARRAAEALRDAKDIERMEAGIF